MAGTVSATIRINDAFSSALSKLKSGVSGSASALSRLGGSAGQTGGMFKSVFSGSLIGSAVGQGIGLITSSLGDAIKRVDTLNNASRSFRNMGFSASNTSKAMRDLDTAVTGLPTPIDTAVRNTQLLAASTGKIGLSTKLFKAMNDGILGFGGTTAQVDTAVTQLSQAFSNGKVDMATWNSMINGGMGPALNSIAKTMHMTTGELKSGLSTGKVSVKDFQDALIKLDQQGGGGLKSLSKIAQDSTAGLGTALANLKTATVRGLAGVVTGFTGAGLTESINGITNKIKAAVPAIESISKKIGTAVMSIAKTVGSQLGKLMDNIGKMDPDVLKQLGAAFAILKMGTKGVALAGIAAGLKILSQMSPSQLDKLAQGITRLAQALIIFKAVKGILGVISGIKGAFSGLGNVGKAKVPVPDGSAAGKSAVGFLKLGAALALIGGAILMAGAGFYLFASAATKLTSAGWPAIAMFAAMLVVLVAIAIAAAVFAPALLTAGIALAIFGAGLLIVSVAIMIVAVGMLILSAALPSIATNGLMAAVAIVALGAALAVFGVLAIVAAVGLILLGVSLAVVGIGFLIAAVGALLFGVAMMIVAVGVTIAAVGMMILAVALPLIAVFGMVAAVGMLMLGVALVVVAAVAMIAGLGMMIFALALVLAAPLMMIAAVGALMLGVAMVVLGAGLITVGAGLMVVAAGLSALASGFSALVSAAVAAVTGMVSAVTSGMAGVVSAVSSGISSAVAAARGFAGALVSVGAQLIQGLINGIKSMIGAAVAAVTSVASSVVNAAKSILHIGSPSKLFNQYGQWVVQGLANGLNANNAAQLASASMAQGVVDAASGLNDMSLTSPGDMLANGFYRAHAAVTDVLSAMRGIGGSPLAVNGQLNTTPSTVPSDSSFGIGGSAPYTTSTTANATQSTSTSSITIAPGAIQVNSTGNTDMDIESLVQQFEDYLMSVNERRG